MVAVYTVARLGLAAQVHPDLEWLVGYPPTLLKVFARDYAEAWR